MRIRPIKALKVLFNLEEKPKFPIDFENDQIEIINEVSEFTMTSNERLSGLIDAVKYVIENNIEGDFIECGVWKGGSVMAIIKTLLKLGNIEKKNIFI
jgi:O-methyltransferase